MSETVSFLNRVRNHPFFGWSAFILGSLFTFFLPKAWDFFSEESKINAYENRSVELRPKLTVDDYPVVDSIFLIKDSPEVINYMLSHRKLFPDVNKYSIDFETLIYGHVWVKNIGNATAFFLANTCSDTTGARDAIKKGNLFFQISSAETKTELDPADSTKVDYYLVLASAQTDQKEMEMLFVYKNEKNVLFDTRYINKIRFEDINEWIVAKREGLIIKITPSNYYRHKIAKEKLQFSSPPYIDSYIYDYFEAKTFLSYFNDYTKEIRNIQEFFKR